MHRNSHSVVDRDTRSAASISLAASGAILKPRNWSEHVAYWISQIGSPPVMGLFALLSITFSLAISSAWLWTGLYVVLAMVIPLVYIIWQVRHGRITDLDIQLREQRKGSTLVTIACFAVAWIAMLIGKAPPLLTVTAGASLIQWLVIFAITLRWKISVHSASASGVTVLILHVLGIAAAPLVITIPLIAWSRVKLRRHTLAQTIAGTLLGSSVFLAAILLTPTL